jgi:sugar/nucleoside kinase (ribokinase family)
MCRAFPANETGATRDVPEYCEGMPHCVFVGLSTIDLVYQVAVVPSQNQKVVARSQDVSVGGPATNAAVTFAHLGGKSTLVTVVGSHALREVVLADLHGFGIEHIDLNPSFAGMPALSAVLVTPDGSRTVVSANATRIPCTPPEPDGQALSTARVLLVDGHHMAAAIPYTIAANSRAVPVVLDGGSWKEGIENLLSHVAIAICSADFLPPGCTTYEESMQYLHEHGVTQVAVSRGEAPILVRDTLGTASIPVRQIRAEDTLGAGDVLHGAFCFALAQGLSFRASLAWAAEIATISCEHGGARSWMSQRAHLPQLLAYK